MGMLRSSGSPDICICKCHNWINNGFVGLLIILSIPIIVMLYFKFLMVIIKI